MSFIAYADRTGVIGFAKKCPAGALPIARHADLERLKSQVSALARVGHDNKTLLVPGVPEAENSDQAVDAMVNFTNRVSARLQEASR
ncbi:hypothetical protein SAMN06265338_1324 [Rhodoblastus acidophilus]|uniref:Host nuclease inhibitor protein n=1 Tax=Rhodoblastus acidophilus TaxID=1074 RepID=A0A212SEC1_RHOAC|nr:hypothetical protein [Rhodoblastus acidophilus]PPQ35156.1 hypothetical protein CKO16_21005 [Rhodoblastus acidophilus]RAI16901.1 hypothetical protein CH337_18925 [Rhodoblastus acidophilus]SNB83999.1 hypothetical protein SAMN06265338_1324 [Rhodoblastus acidophilus]